MIYHTLKKVLNIKFDIVDLTALREDDQMMDKKLLEIGMEVNDSSAYKTILPFFDWPHDNPRPLLTQLYT